MSCGQALAPLPGGKIQYVTPNMLEHTTPDKRFQGWSKHAMYTADGSRLMTQGSHTKFIGHMLLRVHKSQT
jgi:hypothetical protein